MILFAIYFLSGFFQLLKKIIVFINNFDKEIEKLVKKEVETAKEVSLNKITLWLSGQSQKDIENFCISYFVRESTRQFKKHKQLILARVAAYTVAVLLFKEILFRILT